MRERLVPRYQRYYSDPAQDPGATEPTYEVVWEFMVANFNPEALENPWYQQYPEHARFEADRANIARTRYRKYLELPDVPIIRLPSKRRMPQPTLKLPYDNLHDIRLRLQGTLIFVGSSLYYAREVVEVEKEFLLVMEDKDGTRYKCWYQNDAIDLRSIEPQYIRHQATPGYLCRAPSRVQQQGMRADNLYCKQVGRNELVRFGQMRELIEGVTTDVNPWSPAYADLMLKVRALPALRLSKYIALFTRKDKLFAEYRGRLLGEVREDTILTDKHDYSRPWIVDAIHMIGCTPEQRDA